MTNPFSKTTAAAMLPLAAGLAFGGPPALAQSGMNTTALTHEVVLSGLDVPWDMAFLDDGTLFFTEKCHGLSW